MPVIGVNPEFIVETRSGSLYRLLFDSTDRRCKFSLKKLHADASDLAKNDVDVVDIRPARGRDVRLTPYPRDLRLSDVRVGARIIFSKHVGLDYQEMDLDQFVKFKNSRGCKVTTYIKKVYRLKEEITSI